MRPLCSALCSAYADASIRRALSNVLSLAQLLPLRPPCILLSLTCSLCSLCPLFFLSKFVLRSSYVSARSLSISVLSLSYLCLSLSIYRCLVARTARRVEVDVVEVALSNGVDIAGEYNHFSLKRAHRMSSTYSSTYYLNPQARPTST